MNVGQMTTQPKYFGPERRIHKILVTRNTEYHLRAQECVAVRDITSGAWRHNHKALGTTLRGSLVSTSAGGYRFSEGCPEPGHRLYFSNDVYTSPVHTICRPERYIVDCYKN